MWLDGFEAGMRSAVIYRNKDLETRKKTILNQEQVEALKRVIDYLIEEANHYEELIESGLDASNHIWLSVRVLMDCTEL